METTPEPPSVRPPARPLLRQADAPTTEARLRPRLRDAQRDASRARVLDAARELFIDHGYEATTVRMIAERAQLSPAGVFTTFADKADILHHVRMAQSADVLRELECAALRLKGSATERLCELVRVMYEREWPHRPLVLAWIGASYGWSAATESEMRLDLGEMFAGYRGILEDGVRTGEFAPDLDVGLALEMIWGAYLGSWRHTLHGERALEHTLARVDRKVRILCVGFAAPTGWALA
jgi:AcrR family transcriptional regulator